MLKINHHVYREFQGLVQATELPAMSLEKKTQDLVKPLFDQGLFNYLIDDTLYDNPYPEPCFDLEAYQLAKLSDFPRGSDQRAFFNKSWMNLDIAWGMEAKTKGFLVNFKNLMHFKATAMP